jgi:hypothetical protein
MSFSRIIAAVVLGLGVSAANAGAFKFQFKGIASGSLGGQNFTNTALNISLTGNASSVTTTGVASLSGANGSVSVSGNNTVALTELLAISNDLDSGSLTITQGATTLLQFGPAQELIGNTLEQDIPEVALVVDMLNISGVAGDSAAVTITEWNDVAMQSAIPEPSTVSLMLLSTALTMAGRRRRQQ